MTGLAAWIPLGFHGPGLSPGELAAAQEAAGAAFPPDLCELLAEVLPIGGQFPDWRGHARESMHRFRRRVVEGVYFDVEHNDFWLRSWGEKPSDAEARRDIVEERVREAPALIPIYSHRGIPNEPLASGNPVFSVMQTDIIIYGNDLASYLRNEFHRGTEQLTDACAAQPVTIRFWTNMLDPRNGD